MNKKKQVIIGTIVNPVSDTRCDYYERGALHLRKTKLGYEIEKIEEKASSCYPQGVEVIEVKKYLIIPPFFDLHFHWVQDAVCLKPKASLLGWLSKYVWPYEARFQNKKWAQKKAQSFSQKLLKTGTLGGACYGSIHPHTVDLGLKYFKGDFILGNVLMTDNSPEYLLQDKKKALSEVKKLARKYKKRYALTPRFALSVSSQVMKEAASSVKPQGSFIQTHLSENKEEVQAVESAFAQDSFFKQNPTYTEVYEKCDILGSKTILGHGIYLRKKEWEILKKTKTSIAHCPTSNAPHKDRGLGSGLFDFRKAEKHSVRWALGSDIGAGPFLSMVDVINSFVSQNRKVAPKQATYIKGLYRATLASAEILGLSKTQGNFSKNKQAHFLMIPKPKKSYINAEQALKDSLGLCLKNRELSSRFVKRVYYKGKRVV